MQELVPAIWDDLDLAQGTRTPAAVTRTVTLDGRTRRLDLTEDHDQELRDFLEPYLRAGNAPERPARIAGTDRPTVPRGPSDPVRVAWKARMRAFVDAHTGERPELSYRTPGGGINYPARLVDTFNAYERGEDWVHIWDNWKRPVTGMALWRQQAREDREAQKEDVRQ